MNTIEAQQLAKKLREVDFFAQQSAQLDAEFELLVDFVENAPTEEIWIERHKAITKIWPQFNY